jgi:hypothetical protein
MLPTEWDVSSTRVCGFGLACGLYIYAVEFRPKKIRDILLGHLVPYLRIGKEWPIRISPSNEKSNRRRIGCCSGTAAGKSFHVIASQLEEN